MAARKGSGNSNTKKSTAARKTSGTAKKTSAGTGKKKQTKSSTSGRSGAKRGTAGAARKSAAKETTDSAVRSEIGTLVALALTLFATLSVFGLCGSAGAVIRSFLFGVFGILACIVPLLFFLAVMFFVSNLGNGKALGKLAAALLIVPDLCGLIQLIVSPHTGSDTLKEIYAAGTGGGWLGGAVKQCLCSVFDVVGAYLILVLILLICLVVLTEKSLTRWIRTVGGRILGRARDDYDYQVEQNEENRARNEERRNEQRTQREERRRQAEERRRQEDEQRRERQRRTDHKVHGVEISDNTVIGTVDAEAVSGSAAPQTNPEERGSEKSGGADSGKRRRGRSGDSELENQRGDRVEGSDPGKRRNERSEGTDSVNRRNGGLEEPDFGNRRDKKFEGLDSGDQRNDKSGEFDSENRRHEKTGETGMEDRRTEDVTVEWWNPHEGEPVTGDDIDRLEWELKFSAAAEAGDNQREFRNGEAASGGTGAEDKRNPAGQGDRAGEYYFDEEPDEAFEGGVRRLDFMQERVNRRMEEFETQKTGRVQNNGTDTEFEVGTDPTQRTSAGTDTDPMQRMKAGTDTDLTQRTNAGTDADPTQRMKAGTDTDPTQRMKAGTDTGSAQKANVGTDTGSTQKADTGTSGAQSRRAGAGAAATSVRTAGGAENGQKPVPPARKYVKPPTSLLSNGGRAERDSQAELNRVADKLQDTLKRFGVNVTITNVSRGPSVTRYELLPEAGTRVNRITSLSDDIKLALAATDIRIEAPIPGKSAIGIEVPNRRRETVYLKDLVESGELKGHTSKIAFAAGKDIAGKVVVADIAKMPHMLIAGTTGSGKSVFTNSIIMTILFRATPDEVKLIIIDPKVVEFGIYNGIPHLMTPVVTDPRKAAEALKWATAEMSRRYQTFAKENVRDLKGYNKKIEREHLTDKDGQPLQKLPQIVIIIDELADLMMVAAKDVEETICRLAQLARAAGIHLIIATQRPSVDVVTGLIKANIPSRVALLVSSGTDSRTIIDMNGAEKLLGNGDMLFAPSGYAKPVRLQGAFVSDEEVRSVVDFLKKQVPEGGAYDASMFEEIETAESGETGENRDERDPLFAEAGRFLIEKKKASVSLLQRKFRVGFNRAGRIIDQLEEAGVVGEDVGTKPRNVLMTPEAFESYLKESGENGGNGGDH